ncbi:choice-of-anchor Q domain-containing protein [Candidatus Margulisiibacteriota bacterium]
MSTVEALNCTFSGNYAQIEGGVGIGGWWNATNCIFVGNRTHPTAGGGIVFRYGTLNIVNSVFYRNIAGSRRVIQDATLNANNSIFWANSTLFQGGSRTITYSDIQTAGWTAGTGNISAEPMFVSTDEADAANFMRLGGGSPCIDIASLEAPSPDLAGNVRPRGFNNDMGAYEFQGPSIVLEAPKGGESIAALSLYEITYEISPESVIDVYIRLSTNEGATWDTFITYESWSHAAGTNTYAWTVDALVSTECLISIEAVDSASHKWNYDTSYAAFEIHGPSISVEAPNGGELITALSLYEITYEISWESVNEVYIRLSTNGGSTWDTLITYEAWSHPAGVATYEWTVDVLVSTECLISIEAVGSASSIWTNDASNAKFEIGMPISFADVYVSDSTGSDTTGNGTVSSPFKSISKGLSSVEAGGTVHLFTGLYQGGLNRNLAWPDLEGITLKASTETSVCTMDAANADRLILVSNAVQLTIEGITITNGIAMDGNGGGGIYLTPGSTLNLVNTTFTLNSGGGVLIGGAINSDGSYVFADNCYFYGNYGKGGVGYGGTWEANNCTFLENRGGGATTSGGVASGRDASYPNLWIVNYCTFKGNYGTNKGGVFREINFVADNCTFEGNYVYGASTQYPEGGVAWSGTGYITNSFFFDNYATGEGGIHGEGGVFGGVTATVTNCAFNNNTAKRWGGVSYAGAIKFFNCSFNNNDARVAGDITYTTGVTAVNSIFWSDDPFELGFGTVKYSDVKDFDYGGLADGGGNINSDPLFVSTDEASPYFLKLNTGSPCIDSGTAEGAPADDFYGNVRPRGLNYDMGFYEFQGPSIYVKRPNGGESATIGVLYEIEYDISAESVSEVYIWLSTNEGSTWDTLITYESWSHPAGWATYDWLVDDLISTECLISIEVFGDASGVWNSDISNSKFSIVPQQLISDEVWVYWTGGDDTFGTGTIDNPYKTIKYAMTKVATDGAITAYGDIYPEYDISWTPFDNVTLRVSIETSQATIDAQELGRVLNVSSAVDLTIEGISLVNGWVNGPGGGIYIAAAGTNILLKNSLIGNCSAEGTSVGGAIYSASDNIVVNLDNSLISNNSASSGGAFYNGTYKAKDSSIIGNSARGFPVNPPERNGGVIWSGVLEMERCYILNNSASFEGGVCRDSTVVATNCAFSGNTGLNTSLSSASNFIIYNCTTFNNPGSATHAWLPAPNIGRLAYNSIMWEYQPLYGTDAGTVFNSYCDINEGSPSTNGNFRIDPKFVSTIEGTPGFLVLDAGSPCIDRASTEAAAEDINGNVRPHGFNNDVGAFEFQGPSISVEAPNGGETVTAYSSYDITYEISPESVSEVYIRLSTNEGSTWDTFITYEAWSHPAGVATYEWTVNDLLSTECLISIEAVGDISSIRNYDVSGSKFTIASAPSELYVSPTGSDEAGDGTLGDPYLTFQKALDMVAVGGTVMAMQGTHTLATSEFVNNSMINWPDKDNITLRLSPEATEPATIDAVSRGRIIYVSNALNISIEGISAKNGHLDLGGTLNRGMFIYLFADTNLWLSAVEVYSCIGIEGRGIVVYANTTGTNVYAVDSIFDGNNGGSLGFASFQYQGNSLTATNCTFKDGASYIGGVISNLAGTATFQNCRFISNWAGYGGVFANGTTYVSNSVFKDNRASYGGISVNGTTTVTNCAFNNNAAQTLGTIDKDGTWISINSIYWDNGSSWNRPYFDGGTTDITYSNIEPDDFIAGTGNISIEPLWISTVEGNSDYFRLGSRSPCIDSGTEESGIPVIDADGSPRPHNWLADMGPYEFQGPNIDISTPSGGEIYYPGSDVTITWTVTDEYGVASDSNIYYSADGGSTWTFITSQTFATTDRTYTWEAANTFSSDYLISIEAKNASTEALWSYNISDASFEVTASSEVWVSWDTGSDGASGAVDDPYKTITFGMTRVATGGTVTAYGGTYLESNIAWSGYDNITLKASTETTICTIDAETNGRCISFETQVTATIEGFTAMNGSVTDLHGGAFYLASGVKLFLKSTVIKDNQSISSTKQTQGGAIYCVDTNADIIAENCLFKNNAVVQAGINGNGGVVYGGTWTVTNSKFEGNTAPNVGGVALYGTWEVSGSAFIGNYSPLAGVAYESIFKVQDSSFVGNYAPSSGNGGISHLGTWTVTNCVFALNTAQTGGIANGGNWDITNSTFYGNDSTNGSVAKSGTWVSRNCVFWGNVTPCFNVMASNDISYSDIQTNSFVAGTGNISVEPYFVSTVSTEADFLRLGSGSLCIDAASTEAPSPDLAGNVRPHGFNNDMGAYEFQGASILVIDPNGGELVTAEFSYDIVFDVSPEVDEIYIRVSTNEGSSWTEITYESGAAIYSGVSTYEWTPIIDLVSTECLISIEVFDGSIWNYDTSNATFEIEAPIYRVWNTGKQRYQTIAAAFADTGTLAEGDLITTEAGIFYEHDIIWPDIDNITLRGAGQGLATIDAQSNGRGISFEAAVNATIEGFTISYASTEVGGFGAGIKLVGGSVLDLISIDLISNEAASGGAVYADLSNVYANNCNFIGNRSTLGGAVRSGTWEVNNCTFIGNISIGDGGVFSDSGAGPFGGMGEISITNSVFKNNSAGNSGGVFLFYYVVATDSIFIENSATGSGGVFYASKLNAESCTFESNSAVWDGGVMSSGFSIWLTSTVTNCIFSNNTAQRYGGVAEDAKWNVVNSTFYNNNSTTSGDVVFDSTWDIENSIFWGNDDPFQTTTGTIKYSNVEGNDWSSLTTGLGTISADPLFVSTTYGNANFLKLNIGSPCIDTATSEGAPSHDLAGNVRPIGLGFDMGAYEFQGSSIFVIDPNGGELITAEFSYDIVFDVSPEVDEIYIRVSTNEGSSWTEVTYESGAAIYTGVSTYEWTPIIGLASTECLISIEVFNGSAWNYDTSNATFEIEAPVYRVWNETHPKAYQTIQAALGDTGYLSNGDVITTEAGIFNEYDIIWPAFPINNITLRGAGSTETIISTEALGRGISIEGGVSLTIEALTVIGGRAPAAGIDRPGEHGGGVYHPSSSGTLSAVSCRFINNRGSNGAVGMANNAGGDGGAVYTGGGASIVGCLFFDNRGGSSNNNGRGGSGGGVYADAASLFIDSEFTLNRAGAKGGQGGGVYVDSAGTFINCTFSSNESAAGNPVAGSGGGAFVGAAGIFTGCIFTDNTAGNALASPGGGGGFLCFGNVTLTDCSFFGNKAGSSSNSGAGGGGAYIGGTATVTNCVFSRNEAGDGSVSNGGRGGGIWFAGSVGGSIVNSWFYMNTAGDGGVPGSGGGVYLNNGDITLVNCTFYNNSPGVLATLGSGGGVYLSGTGSRLIVNSIFWANVGVSAAQIYGASSIDYTNVQSGEAGISGSNYGTGNISAEPRFISTDEASLYFLVLNDGSPCIDTASTEAPSPDLAGNVRPHGLGNDMGVYEFQGPSVFVIDPNGGEVVLAEFSYDITFNVSPEVDEIYIRLSTNEGVSWDVLLTSEPWSHSGVSTYEWIPTIDLASTECLISIEVFDGSTWNYDTSNATFEIEVPVYRVWNTGKQRYQTIAAAFADTGTLAEGDLITTEAGIFNEHDIVWPNINNITLRGAGSTETIISGEALGRIITVEGSDINLTIEALTIQDGKVTGNGAGISAAGGYYSVPFYYLPHIWLNDVVIKNCTAEGTTPNGSGGAFYSVGGRVYADNCSFINNYGVYRGGVAYHDGANGDRGSWIVRDSEFRNNRGGYAGVSAYVDTWVATNCAFVSNEAVSTNAGVTAGGNWTVYDCLFAG